MNKGDDDQMITSAEQNVLSTKRKRSFDGNISQVDAETLMQNTLRTSNGGRQAHSYENSMEVTRQDKDSNAMQSS